MLDQLDCVQIILDCKRPELYESQNNMEFVGADRWTCNAMIMIQVLFDFELGSSVYAKARIPPASAVNLWLGADVMLQYPIEEAQTLLVSFLLPTLYVTWCLYCPLIGYYAARFCGFNNACVANRYWSLLCKLRKGSKHAPIVVWQCLDSNTGVFQRFVKVSFDSNRLPPHSYLCTVSKNFQVMIAATIFKYRWHRHSIRCSSSQQWPTDCWYVRQENNVKNCKINTQTTERDLGTIKDFKTTTEVISANVVYISAQYPLNGSNWSCHSSSQRQRCFIRSE